MQMNSRIGWEARISALDVMLLFPRIMGEILKQ
ncbi:unnamed protein product, partial [marine sediment metagenome]